MRVFAHIGNPVAFFDAKRCQPVCRAVTTLIQLGISHLLAFESENDRVTSFFCPLPDNVSNAYNIFFQHIPVLFSRPSSGPIHIPLSNRRSRAYSLADSLAP